MDMKLEEFLNEIKKNKKVSPKHMRNLMEEFNETFWKELRKVLESGVIKLSDMKLDEILNEMKKNKKVSPNHMKNLMEEFNERFWKALRKVLENGVKKYLFQPSSRIAWIVIGNLRDYLIHASLYCPCEDFYLKVVIKKTAKMCYHLLSKILAESLDYYEEIRIEDERYDSLMYDWKQL